MGGFDIYHMAKCVCVLDDYNCTNQIWDQILMFLTLDSKRDFKNPELIDWSRVIATYLLPKTLNLAVDHWLIKKTKLSQS